jgi:hypothetical protein
MDLTEHRRHRRFLAWLEAVVRDESGTSVRATLVELSHTGALIASGDCWPTGAKLSVFLRRRGELVQIQSHVVHSWEGPGQLAGVQFEVEQPPGTVDAIDEILSELEAGSQPRRVAS